MRPHLRTLLVLALTVGLVALFLRDADLAGVWRGVREGRLDLLALALVTTALTYVIRAFRWRYLLAPIGTTRFWSAFQATVIGFAASFLLPARAGEFLRPWVLARKEGLSAAAAFATIILERLFDLIVVLVFLGGYLLLFDPGMASADPAVFAAVRAGGAVAAGAAAAALLLFMWLSRHRAALDWVTQLVTRLLPHGLARRLVGLIELFARGLAVLRDPRRVVAVLVWSVPLWVSIAAGIWLASRAFAIDIPFTGSFLMMALLVVGVAVPTPGSVGGYHEAFRIGATSFFGAPNDRAVGAAIVLHAISFVPVTIAGIVFMAREGLSLSRMREISSRARVEEGA